MGKLSILSIICSLAILLLGSGCTSSGEWNPLPQTPRLDVSGRYLSDNLPGLGELEMNVYFIEEGRFFRAYIDQRVNGGDGQSVGVGTIGDGHLILNFDRTLTSDYYFEGNAVLNGSDIEALVGQFIFPGEGTEQAVTFTYAGEAPPEEELNEVEDAGDE